MVMFSEADDIEAYRDLVKYPELIGTMEEDGVERNTQKLYELKKDLVPSSDGQRRRRSGGVRTASPARSWLEMERFFGGYPRREWRDGTTFRASRLDQRSWLDRAGSPAGSS
jgi:hypothetical protein